MMQGQRNLFDDSEEGAPSSPQPQPSRIGGRGALHNPDQFKMFMTPREIKQDYQVLDADREESTSDRYYEPTNSPLSTAGEPNIPIPTDVRRYRVEQGSAHVPAGWDWAVKRHGNDLKNYTHLHGDDYSPESDSQVWDRKLHESQMHPSEYAEVHGPQGSQENPPGWSRARADLEAQGSYGPSLPGHVDRHMTTGEWEDYDADVDAHEMRIGAHLDRLNSDWYHKYAADDAPSLYDKIKETPGGVLNPVHLGTGGAPGSQGKPQVYGGHHRLAAMSHLNPDQLIPVVHHGDFWQARKGESGYEYT